MYFEEYQTPTIATLIADIILREGPRPSADRKERGFVAYMEEEEWHTVPRRSSKGKRRKKPIRGECGVDVFEAPPTMPSGLLKTIETRSNAIQNMDWWHALLKISRQHAKPSRLVCYGLGSVFSSRNAQWQVALLLALQSSDIFEAKPIIENFDPCLSGEENEFLLRQFEFVLAPKVPPEVDQPTLFYMPHCPQRLYGHLVEINKFCLDNVLLLGNSFLSYAARSLDLDPRINGLLPRISEPLTLDKFLKTDNEETRAFNDTALVVFNQNNGPRLLL